MRFTEVSKINEISMSLRVFSLWISEIQTRFLAIYEYFIQTTVSS